MWRVGSPMPQPDLRLECYNPIANEWRTLPSMGNTRWYCAAVACDV